MKYTITYKNGKTLGDAKEALITALDSLAKTTDDHKKIIQIDRFKLGLGRYHQQVLEATHNKPPENKNDDTATAVG